MRPGIALAALLALLCFLNVDADAQTPARDAERERAIRQQLEAVAPPAVETFERGTAALDADDYAGAASHYEEVLRKAPQFTPAMRRLGLAWLRTGRDAEGLALLEKAVDFERSPENLASLAKGLAYPNPDKPSKHETKERALQLASEADAKSASADSSYPGFVAHLALDLQHEESFRAAVGTLRRKFPDELPTHYYSAIDAAIREDWLEAESSRRSRCARCSRPTRTSWPAAVTSS